LFSNYGSIMQRPADGHIAVIGHDQEGAGLHREKSVHDEHLEADREGDGPEVKPEDGQHLGNDSEAEHDIQQGEQAEQVVHGLMQRGFQLDGDEKDGVGSHGQDEEETEWQGQPELPDRRCDKAIQDKF
jgi:hypothetical protein